MTLADDTADRFLAAVEKTIARYQMLDRDDTVLVGVSGGADSVALLQALIRLRSKWSLKLVVAHLNHGLRGTAADGEASFVRRLSQEGGLPCEITKKDAARFASNHRLSLQEGARRLRYAFYREAAAKHGANRIALGHHADDNAESILIHLLRGTGPRGLMGIPPARGGGIIRPLIEVTRDEIDAFLQAGGLAHVKDASNFETKYLRNRIRHDLMPGLKARYNAGIVSALNRLASILRDEEAFWDEAVSRALGDVIVEQTPQALSLAVGGLAAMHPAMMRRLVRRAVRTVKGDLRRLGLVHVEAVVKMVNALSPSGQVDLPHGVRAIRDRDVVRFILPPEPAQGHYEYDIADLGATFIREIDCCLKLSLWNRHDISDPRRCAPSSALFDMDEIRFPLKVRNFRKGDRFRPLGMPGSQKVKAFFINRKVPRLERSRCPLLLSGDRIIWIGGHRIDDSAKITEKTNRVLKAELAPGKCQ